METHLHPVYPGNCGDTDLTTTNTKNVTCPRCQYRPPLGPDHPLWPVFQLVADEYWVGMDKYGPWSDIDDDAQFCAIRDEYHEFTDAYFSSDVHGPHGELNEIVDLISVAAKRHVELSRLPATIIGSGESSEVTNGEA